MIVARFPPAAAWRPPAVCSLPRWAGAARVAVDTETRDPLLRELGPGVRRGAQIVGVSFAIDGGPPASYLPIGHEAGDNLPADLVLAYLREQAREFTGEIVGLNLPYDLDFLAQAGVVFRRARRFRDVGVAAVLINELHRSYSLESIAQRLGLPGKEERGLREAVAAYCLRGKVDLWRLPARYVGPYAEADAALPLTILRMQEAEIERQDLGQIWDLESRVLPVALKIRRRGVRIDFDALDRIERWAAEQEADFLTRVRGATGVDIPPADLLKKELTARALEAVGCRLPNTPTGQPKTDARTLGAVDHDVGRWLVRAKKFHKMRVDFAGSIRRHAVGGRIHATFRQLVGSTDDGTGTEGAAFGRFSSVDPNLQQQYSPEKEPEISARWREIFLPEDGARWAAADFSAQEPRMLVHYAEICGARGGREMADRYRGDPFLDLHQAAADLCGIPRKPAKIILLGLCYGMGGGKLCASLGYPTELWIPPGDSRAVVVAGDQGKALLRRFDEMVPFAREMANRAKAVAESRGWIRTLGGRVCHFPPLGAKDGFNWMEDGKPSGGFDWAHKALNRIIQGGSADQGKEALVAADDAGIFVQIPVHDELDGSVADDREAENLGNLMANAVRLRVPSVVDVETGGSWGGCRLLKRCVGDHL